MMRVKESVREALGTPRARSHPMTGSATACEELARFA